MRSLDSPLGDIQLIALVGFQAVEDDPYEHVGVDESAAILAIEVGAGLIRKELIAKRKEKNKEKKRGSGPSGEGAIRQYQCHSQFDLPN